MHFLFKFSAALSACLLVIAGAFFLLLNAGADTSQAKSAIEKIENNRLLLAKNIRQLRTARRKLENKFTDFNELDWQQLNSNHLLLQKTKQAAQRELNDTALYFKLEKTMLDDRKHQVSNIVKFAAKEITAYKKNKATVSKPDKTPKPIQPDPTVPKPVKPKPVNPQPQPQPQPKPITPPKDNEVILRKPKYLPANYPFPLNTVASAASRRILIDNIISLKHRILTRLQNSIESDGSFNAFSSLQKPYAHIGSSALGYAILSQKGTLAEREKVIKWLMQTAKSSDIKNILTSELAYLVLGIVLAQYKATSDLTNLSNWQPIKYKHTGKFSVEELKLLRWALKELHSRQAPNGGWGSLFCQKSDLHDYDVFTSSIVLIALTEARLAGLKEDVDTKAISRGCEFLVKMQKQGGFKKKPPFLDNNNKPVKDALCRGWGLGFAVKSNLRTTALALAALSKAMLLFKNANKPSADKFLQKMRKSIIDGFAYVYNNFAFSKDYLFLWGLMQAVATIDFENVRDYDFFSELWTFFADRNRIAEIADCSFFDRCISYLTVSLLTQSGNIGLKPFIVKGYQK